MKELMLLQDVLLAWPQLSSAQVPPGSGAVEGYSQSRFIVLSAFLLQKNVRKLIPEYSTKPTKKRSCQALPICFLFPLSPSL